jgi:hypothetical protein
MANKRQEFERLADEKQHSLVSEFWMFIVENKAWWMVPLILVFGMLAVVLVLGSSGAAPFIYTLF